MSTYDGAAEARQKFQDTGDRYANIRLKTAFGLMNVGLGAANQGKEAVIEQIRQAPELDGDFPSLKKRVIDIIHDLPDDEGFNRSFAALLRDQRTMAEIAEAKKKQQSEEIERARRATQSMVVRGTPTESDTNFFRLEDLRKDEDDEDKPVISMGASGQGNNYMMSYIVAGVMFGAIGIAAVAIVQHLNREKTPAVVAGQGDKGIVVAKAQDQAFFGAPALLENSATDMDAFDFPAAALSYDTQLLQGPDDGKTVSESLLLADMRSEEARAGYVTAKVPSAIDSSATQFSGELGLGNPRFDYGGSPVATTESSASQKVRMTIRPATPGV